MPEVTQSALTMNQFLAVFLPVIVGGVGLTLTIAYRFFAILDKKIDDQNTLMDKRFDEAKEDRDKRFAEAKEDRDKRFAEAKEDRDKRFAEAKEDRKEIKEAVQRLEVKVHRLEVRVKGLEGDMGLVKGFFFGKQAPDVRSRGSEGQEVVSPAAREPVQLNA